VSGSYRHGSNKAQTIFHTIFHKTPAPPADEEAGVTRLYRWHIDAALYEL
jgi:hypothetical protein